MPLPSLATALLWAIPSLMLASLVLVAIGLRAKSWLQLQTAGQMRFRKSPFLRAGAAAVGLSLGCVGVLSFTVENAAPHGRALSQGDHAQGDHVAIFLQTAVWACLALMLLSLCGPSDLDLDGQRRAYFWRSGAFWPRTRSGTWDDFAGIYVSQFKGRYIVGLRWKTGVRSCALGKFKRREDADDFAAQTARKLDLPRVAAPATPQLRDIWKA